MVVNEFSSKKRNKKNTQPVAYAFIDSQNLHLGIRCLGWSLDFRKFRQYLRDKYGVLCAYLFIGNKPGNESLYATLQRYGYIVVFKPILEYKNGQIKGNVDAELVLHSMIQFPNYDKAIIVSNDGDFHCLIEYLFDQTKLCKILVPNKKYSRLLKTYSQYIERIDLLKQSLEIKKTKISVRSKS